jgi:hypothetical protein
MDERYDMVRTVCDGRFRYIRNYTPNRIWGQHQSYAWQMRSYQEWEGAHLSGRLSAAQDRFWNEKPFEEFYDLTNDADQITNLIGHAGYLERIEAMREALDQHILNINDNGFIPEGSRIEGYTASRADGAYPLREVMTLAAKAAQRNPKELNDFTNHLSSKNEIMRYWAAQGLLMLGDRAASATDILRHVLTEDQSAHVRIVAAEALATLGEAPVAVTVLAYILDTDPSPRVRLQALNALTYINEHARLALPAITRAESSEDEYLIVAARYLRSVLENRYTPELPIVGPRAIPMNKKHDQAKSLL